jgi:hypothetical protein
MATRSTTSEFQPAPPNVRFGGKQNGRFSAAVTIKTTASSPGVKPNMCCAPTTNGDRVAGLAPSQPASAKSMKGMGARLSF